MRYSIIFFFLFCGIVFVESKAVDDHHQSYKCGDNEVWKDCGGCDGSCTNLYPCCNYKGPPGCYCKKGYVRDACGLCIRPCDCPVCKNPNEEWRCDNCDPTCDNPMKECCCACRWGCFCKEGYARDCDCKCVKCCHDEHDNNHNDHH